jgi:cytochrome b subunit of formate dehydrogenase
MMRGARFGAMTFSCCHRCAHEGEPEEENASAADSPCESPQLAPIDSKVRGNHRHVTLTPEKKAAHVCPTTRNGDETHVMRHKTLLVLLTLILVGLAGGAGAQDPALGVTPIELDYEAQKTTPSARETPPEDCSDCHNGEADASPLAPPYALLPDSVHSDEDCDSCHESIDMEELDLEAENPHGDDVEPVDCGDCHDEEAEIYRKHGRLTVGKDPDLPECWDCHGHHDILPSSDRHADTHPINLPNTCRSCHTNVDIIKKHNILRDKPIKLYQSSVHGKASRKGLYVAATCNDCHSANTVDGDKSAHRILSPAEPESTIYHFNIPKTCAQCHESVAMDYMEGIHGQFVAAGEVDSPVCTHCHGEHGIISPSDPRSPVSAGRVAEATCAPCHESEVLNQKYGIPAGRLRSYIDSYHGLKSKAGDVRVANCASCHGAHRILPHTDLTSSIHPDHLQETCGECHPGISTELAAVPIHSTATGIKAGWPGLITAFYLWLIAVIIGGMVLHNLGDWLRHIRDMRKKPYVIRMTLNEALQHWILTIAFMVMVISGFSLRFSEAWWVQLLFGWGEGEGFLIRGTVHRTAAVIFILCCLWHVLFLFTRRGRRTLHDMIPNRGDLTKLRENVLYFLGRRECGARFGRFSYMEKAEYWALFWGAILMTATGLLLWFDNYFIRDWNLPKGLLDVALVVHYYEAWLATLAIVVWHGYAVLLNPRVYPMNPAWLSGKMPKDMYTHEHPEAPKLKTRVFKIRYEEELEEEEREHPSIY